MSGGQLPFDLHTHTQLCKHASRLSTRRWIDRAGALGLRGIAVCDHNPFEGDDYDIYRMDMADFDTFLEYCEDARQYAAAKYPNLEIIRTLEVDYVPERHEETRKFLETRCKGFDAFLGSIHFNSQRERDYLSSLPEGKMLEAYVSRFEEAAKSHMFDTMSHPCFYRKRVQIQDPELEKTFIRRMVEIAAREGVCLEVNTSGWKVKDGNYDTFLDEYGLRLCAELHVPLTMGSDAHQPECVGKLFPETAEFIKRCGITQAHFFRNHVRIPYDL